MKSFRLNLNWLSPLKPGTFHSERITTANFRHRQVVVPKSITRVCNEEKSFLRSSMTNWFGNIASYNEIGELPAAQQDGGCGMLRCNSVRFMFVILSTCMFLINMLCAARASALIYIARDSCNMKLDSVISAYLLHYSIQCEHQRRTCSFWVTFLIL
jgi:hypothetical protein